MPKGAFTAELLLPDNGFGQQDPSLILRATLHVKGDHVVVDFAGTGPQTRGGINCPIESARGAVFSTFRRLVFSDCPLTTGMMKPIEIKMPKGSLVNPDFPAAVGGRAMTMFLVEDLMHRALAKSMPEKIPVPTERWDLLHFTSTRPDGSESVVMDALPGGWGARPSGDGPDGISQSAVSDIPIEILERDQTMVIEEFTLVPDSGGPGRFRGSQAIARTVRYRRPGRLHVRTIKLVPTPGLAGGQAGAPSLNRFVQEGREVELPRSSYLHLETKPGDRFHHRVNGCGGYGDPLTRDPARVLQDVIDERVTAKGAEEQYGVVIDTRRMIVDEGATAALRRQRRGEPVAAQ
jgi:N-methylhydantoinase B